MKSAPNFLLYLATPSARLGRELPKSIRWIPLSVAIFIHITSSTSLAPRGGGFSDDPNQPNLSESPRQCNNMPASQRSPENSWARVAVEDTRVNRSRLTVIAPLP